MMKVCALALLLCAGCGVSVKATEINAVYTHGARDPEDIEVYTASRPDRPIVDVSLLEARDGLLRGGTEALIEALRKHAARHGCDGIVVHGVATDDVLTDGGIVRTKNATATCFVYDRYARAR